MFFKKTRRRLKERAKAHVGNIAAPISEFKRRYGRIRSGSREVPPGSFTELLERWNCTAEDIPVLKRHLKARLAIFVLVGLLLGGFLLGQGKWAGALIVAPPVLVGVLTSLWRLYLIRTGSYLPFEKWFFSKGSGEERGSEGEDQP